MNDHFGRDFLIFLLIIYGAIAMVIGIAQLVSAVLT